MSAALMNKRWIWPLLALTVACAAVASWRADWPVRWSSPPPTPHEDDPLAPPPYSASRFLNAGGDAEYVGSAACAKCHVKQHQSYLLTAHSRALSDADPDAEPPDATFKHVPSGRTYRVYRAGGKLRHEEVVRSAGGKEIARVDLPVRYLIGSGHFTRTYLVEVDGFLHESPITWYASKQKWGVSPGYDSPRHFGFERAVRVGCLVCHAGRVESPGSEHKVTFHEKAIGCENCHGPGSLHQQLHLAKKLAPGQEDLTIVHPGKLPRGLKEAVCAGCHLSAAATVYLRGRQPTDVRPGRPLSDYRTDYRLPEGGDRMTVVGHVEQLRQSACYQKSADMTCTTCHDPHQRQPPKDPVAFRRGQCLGCHESRPCGLDEAVRRKKEAGDNCVACHMPRGDTDVPHVAFTHHRIGHHAPAARPPRPGDPLPELVAIGDAERLGVADRERNLGLAYLLLTEDGARPHLAEAFAERARQRLEAAHAAGLRDGATTQGLAELYWRKDPPRAAAYAREALGAKDSVASTRVKARLVLAADDFNRRDYASAVAMLQELTRERRYAEDWRLLGVSYLKEGQPDRALAALRQALAIRPTRPTTHLALAETYRQLGDDRRAQEHAYKGQWLLEHNQD